MNKLSEFAKKPFVRIGAGVVSTLIGIGGMAGSGYGFGTTFRPSSMTTKQMGGTRVGSALGFFLSFALFFLGVYLMLNGVIKWRKEKKLEQ